MDRRHLLRKSLALAVLLIAGAATASTGDGAGPTGASASRAFFRAVTALIRVQPPGEHGPRVITGVRG